MTPAYDASSLVPTILYFELGCANNFPASTTRFNFQSLACGRGESKSEQAIILTQPDSDNALGYRFYHRYLANGKDQNMAVACCKAYIFITGSCSRADQDMTGRQLHELPACARRRLDKLRCRNAQTHSTRRCRNHKRPGFNDLPFVIKKYLLILNLVSGFRQRPGIQRDNANNIFGIRKVEEFLDRKAMSRGAGKFINSSRVCFP